MVDSLATYIDILQRSVALCDTLARVYEPDAALDWASRTLLQLGNLRMGLTGRLVSPKLTPGQISIVIGLLGRYPDSHWADYPALAKPDAAKRTQVVALHEELTAVMNEMADLYNALFVDNQPK